MGSSSARLPDARNEMDAAIAGQYARLQLSHAFDLLTVFRRLTLSAVLNHLDGLRFRLNIFHLYQHLFPHEYACSQASPHSDATGSGHSDREIEFFQLVLSRLFPILDPDLLDDEIWFDGIPIEVCGLTYDDADQLDVGYRVLAAAIGALGLEWYETADEWPVELPAPAARLPGKVLDLNQFDRLCRKRGAAWRNLAVLARLVCNETGNDFLDLTHEVPLEWPPWHKRTSSSFTMNGLRLTVYSHRPRQRPSGSQTLPGGWQPSSHCWIGPPSLLKVALSLDDNLMLQNSLFPTDITVQAEAETAARLPDCDLPAYRVLTQADGCSATELLAALIGGSGQLEIADCLLAKFGSLHGIARASVAELTSVRGVGDAIAARLKATLEISRRLLMPHELRRQISSPADIAAILQPLLMYRDQEVMCVVLLDTRNRVMGEPQEIYRGSLNNSMIRIGELFRAAIKANASAFVMGHNHPSGDPSPSPEDVAVTRLVVQAGKLLDIECMDHIVIGHPGFVSLKERALGFEGTPVRPN